MLTGKKKKGNSRSNSRVGKSPKVVSEPPRSCAPPSRGSELPPVPTLLPAPELEGGEGTGPGRVPVCPSLSGKQPPCPLRLPSLISVTGLGGRCALGASPGDVGAHSRLEGASCWGQVRCRVAGRRQLAQHIGPKSGIRWRSEVAALGLHVAGLSRVTSGQLGEAGSHFGPGVLGQWFSRRSDVPVRQSRGELD